MTTNQRSVAEDLIARTPEGSWDHARAVERLVRAIIGKRFDEPYTADDLLAWLREQITSEVEPGNGEAIEMFWDPERPDAFSVTIGYDTWDAPTLLAALEQAVRAVAGE